MHSLHPHWQTTDEEEPAVRVTDKNQEKTAGTPQPTPDATVPRAKRGPAAFIGIAIFLGIGVALFQGVNGLMGQVGSTDDTVIRITEEGTEPPTVTVQPGRKIRWDNGSTIPHILESDTLPTADGAPFVTTALFPNASYEYIVPAGSPDGTHAYASKTAAHVTGSIVIETAPAALPVNDAPDTATDNTPPPPVTSTFPDNTQPAPAEVLPTGSIPQNPYTVAGGGVPLPPRQPAGGAPAATQGNVTQHVPLANTTTGMGAWVILGITAISLLYVVNRAVRVL